MRIYFIIGILMYVILFFGSCIKDKDVIEALKSYNLTSYMLLTFFTVGIICVWPIYIIMVAFTLSLKLHKSQKEES